MDHIRVPRKTPAILNVNRIDYLRTLHHCTRAVKLEPVRFLLKAYGQLSHADSPVDGERCSDAAPKINLELFNCPSKLERS